MSHCLTQPEEIDQILNAMAGEDREVDTPTPDGVQLGGTILDVERDGRTVVASFHCSVVHEKSAYGLPDS